LRGALLKGTKIPLKIELAKYFQHIENTYYCIVKNYKQEAEIPTKSNTFARQNQNLCQKL